MWDVTRKENFGARIRNARVVGSLKDSNSERTNGVGSQEVKDEDDDISMDSAQNFQQESLLSPQLLLLQLETGDSVFLMLQETTTGGWEFISSIRKRVPKMMLNLQPGTHLAVDPSSRYMAIGCSESLFVIYALHSKQELSAHYKQGTPVQPIEEQNMKAIHTQGVILKLEFLYPKPTDPKHIILLALVVKRGRTRMILYEWETGRDLNSVRPNNSRGHGLAADRQMPLLLIPLTFKSSFLLIYEDAASVCQRFLEGTPEFLDIAPHIINIDITKLHHGKGKPLWTAWARPRRLKDHVHKGRDDIYLVREDGGLKFLEIDSTSDTVVKAGVNVGPLGSNCGTALAALSYNTYDTYRTYGGGGDLLVAGGTSCGGGTYLVSRIRSLSHLHCYTIPLTLAGL